VRASAWRRNQGSSVLLAILLTIPAIYVKSVNDAIYF
jgi:hypothetical protein